MSSRTITILCTMFYVLRLRGTKLRDGVWRESLWVRASSGTPWWVGAWGLRGGPGSNHHVAGNEFHSVTHNRISSRVETHTCCSNGDGGPVATWLATSFLSCFHRRLPHTTVYHHMWKRIYVVLETSPHANITRRFIWKENLFNWKVY